MPNSSERFLLAATKPLADDLELQIDACRTLSERIDATRAEDPSWDVATDALQRHDSSRLRRRWSLILLVIVGIWFAWCQPQVISMVRSLPNLNTILTAPFATTKTIPKSESYGLTNLTRHLTEDQKLIVLGDTRLKELCERFPDNPAYYADYAIAYVTEHKALPPGYAYITKRIDPDNGWFPCFAAAVLSNKVAESPKQSSEEKQAHVPKKWTIHDPARLAESMQLLAEGCRLPRFESYQAARLEQKLKLITPATDFRSYIERKIFVASQLSSGLAWSNLTSTTAAQAELAANTGDREAFQRVLADWRTLAPRLTRNSIDLIDILVAQAYAAGCVTNLQDAASRLGFESDAAQLLELQQRLDADAEARKARRGTLYKNDIASRHGAIPDAGTSLVAAQVNHPPPINREDLAPGRLGDQGWFGRIACQFLAWVMLVCCGISTWARFLRRKEVRRTSERLASTLTPGDWLWILACGSVLPVLLHEAIYRLTPLGGRDWSIAYGMFLGPLTQFLGWTYLFVHLPLLAACWRLRKRLDALDLGLPKPGRIAVGAVILLAAIPLAGITYLGGNPEIWGSVGAGCLVIVALGMGIWALKHRKALVLGHATVVRLLTPVFALSALLLSALSFAYYAQERYWVPRNHVGLGGGDGSGALSYEQAVVEQRKIEVAEILAPLRASR
ncbi:MAG: hypothetical protein QM755_07715 [Luteolibacter sp.]